MAVLPPATWTLGLNRRFPDFANWPSPWTLDLQLHNLSPGEFWNPAFETELHTLRTLIAGPNPGTFVFRTPNFAWLFQFFIFEPRIQVNSRTTGTQAFLFFFRSAEHQRVRNDITDPADQYAFDGTATFAWHGVP